MNILTLEIIFLAILWQIQIMFTIYSMKESYKTQGNKMGAQFSNISCLHIISWSIFHIINSIFLNVTNYIIPIFDARYFIIRPWLHMHRKDPLLFCTKIHIDLEKWTYYKIQKLYYDHPSSGEIHSHETMKTYELSIPRQILHSLWKPSIIPSIANSINANTLLDWIRDL